MDALLLSLLELYQQWLKSCPTGQAELASAVATLQTLPPAQTGPSNEPVVVQRYLSTVLAQATDPIVAQTLQQIRAVADKLDWVTMPPTYMGADFVEQFAYVRLGGPNIAPNRPTVFPTSQLKFGLSLQAPNLFYPPHRHRAVEFYGILSGTALWQWGKRPFSPQPPPAFIHHPSNLPHAMYTQDQPLLTTYIWVGEIDSPIET